MLLSDILQEEIIAPDGFAAAYIEYIRNLLMKQHWQNLKSKLHMETDDKNYLNFLINYYSELFKILGHSFNMIEDSATDYDAASVSRIIDNLNQIQNNKEFLKYGVEVQNLTNMAILRAFVRKINKGQQGKEG